MKHPYAQADRTTLLGVIAFVLLLMSDQAWAACEAKAATQCAGAQLDGRDWRNANLQGGDFRNANLKHANLSGANLRGANLRGANLQFARLQQSDLSGADLEGADLRWANLERSTLVRASLAGDSTHERDAAALSRVVRWMEMAGQGVKAGKPSDSDMRIWSEAHGMIRDA